MTYGSFDYTSLLYLSDYLDDFGGGRFVFVEEGANTTVEPRAGGRAGGGGAAAGGSREDAALTEHPPRVGRTQRVGLHAFLPPPPGRVSFFTSGSENLHRVEKVHWGTRYAITIAFTCNPDLGIADPALT